MKTFKYFIVLFVALFLQSCNREQVIEVPKVTSQQQIEMLKNSGSKGVPFPEGSKAMKLSDDLVKIILPEDMYFVVKNEEGKIFRIGEVEVRSTCNQGSGCSPVSALGGYYCVMNEGYKVCILSTLHKKQNVTILGVMNQRRGLGFIGKEKDLFTITEKEVGTQYGITGDFFECEEVKSALDEIYGLAFRGKVPDFIKNRTGEIPPNYVYTKVEFLGNIILLLLRDDMVDENSFTYKITDVESGINCKCYKGKGCKVSSKYVAVYCDAGSCSDCAMIDKH